MTQKYANINPANNPAGPATDFNNTDFAALVNVKSSRYFKREYDNPDYKPVVAIKWKMGTTKGNTFERDYNTGVIWEDGIISEDGKKITTAIKPNSGARYLLDKAIAAEFPANKIIDDISVFEGETFFMATDINPRAKGAYKGLFPKQYHPEGWDAALKAALERRAQREAQGNAPTYGSTPAVPTGSYTPPPIVSAGPVTQMASEALTEILTKVGKPISRNEIPAKLNDVAPTKVWGRPENNKMRQEVTYALWDMQQLAAVVNSNPALKLDGETVSFK